MTFSKNTLHYCQAQLLETKESLLNRLNRIYSDFKEHERSGDDADLSTSNLAEHAFVTTTKRIRTQLLEIEKALLRIQLGAFGLCEVTQEPIEEARLKAIPWTRLSIEGAEIKDSLKKKFA